jgi:ankyrin repeat protein
MPMMDLLLANGADINAQITGTLTYSMRVTRAPSANEGMTALHYAALNGRPELVRYLLGKGARMDLLDAEGRKPIDMLTAPRPINPANPVGPIPAAAATEIRAALTAK